MKQNIVFFGSSRYVLPIIKVLMDKFNLSLVVTTEENSSDAVPSFCIKNKIPYLSVSNLRDSNLKSKFLNLKSDFAVLADFGLIIPNKILDIFPKGIINLHPSLLPKYRGPSPVQAAILNGEKITGISIILLDDKVDHGPILFQKEEEILDNDTSESLYQRLFKIGANHLYQTIQKYTKERLKSFPQEDKKATFTNLFKKDDGFMDIENPPLSEEIKRMIRAYFPWPGVFFKTSLNGKVKIIKLLPNEEIQIEGKKPMNHKDFANGYTEGKEILKKLGLN